MPPVVARSPVVFRSVFNRTLCVIAWGAMAAVIGIVLASPGGLGRPGVALGAVAVAAIFWVVFWSPNVRVDDDEVTIVNVLREITIPWAALIHLETRYALTLFTPGRRFRATAAPAPGQAGGLRAAREARNRAGVRTGDLETTDSGRAAALVRERWELLRDGGAIETGTADTALVRIRLRIVQIATLVAAAALLTAVVVNT